MAEFSVPACEVIRGNVVWTRGEVVKIGCVTGVTNLGGRRGEERENTEKLAGTRGQVLT